MTKCCSYYDRKELNMISREKDNAIAITTKIISNILKTNHLQPLTAIRSFSNDSWLIHYVLLFKKQEIEFCAIIYDSNDDITFLNNDLESINDLLIYVSENFQSE